MHFDHHRPHGAPVQINEITDEAIKSAQIGDDVVVATTMLDADACVAAAYTLSLLEGNTIPKEAEGIMQAIAWDCDHLTVVPQDLQQHADLARQATAYVKYARTITANDMGFSNNQNSWTPEQKLQIDSVVFEALTQKIMDAAESKGRWPGENGEAEAYWQEQDAKVDAVRAHITVQEHDGVKVGIINLDKDLAGVYIDPRTPLKILRENDDDALVTVTVNHTAQGVGYVLGCNPAHPLWNSIDLHGAGVFRRLAYLHADAVGVDHARVDDSWGKQSFAAEVGFPSFGGRATVGGRWPLKDCPLNPEDVARVLATSVSENIQALNVAGAQTVERH